MMTFRKATEQDLDQIMHIIDQAKIYFKENHIDQWQNQYPNPDIIMKDIENGYTNVLIQDDKIVATASITFDTAENYETIYEGKWRWDGHYATIQRLAVDQNCKGKGLSSLVIKYVEEMCVERGVKSIRVVTHENNYPMQKVLYKNNFEHCGYVIVRGSEKRIAFDKVL